LPKLKGWQEKVVQGATDMAERSVPARRAAGTRFRAKS
jgi:hypothetical protein